LFTPTLHHAAIPAEGAVCAKSFSEPPTKNQGSGSAGSGSLKLQILRLGDDIIGPFSGRGFHECADRAGGLGQELAGFFPFEGSVPGHGEQQ